MRLTTEIHKKKKAKAIELFNKGFRFYRIAIKVGVTEKTIGKWLRPYKAKLIEINQREQKLFKTLDKMLENPDYQGDERIFDVIGQIYTIHKNIKERIS